MNKKRLREAIDEKAAVNDLMTALEVSKTVLEDAAKATCWDCMSTLDFGFDFSAYNIKKDTLPKPVAVKLQKYIVINKTVYEYLETRLFELDEEIGRLINDST